MAAKSNSGNRSQRSRAPQKTSTSARKTSSGSKSGSRKKVTEPEPTPGFLDYFHAFSKTRYFMPVMIVTCIVVAVLLDLLLSWNNYDRFFLILGIEIIAVAIVWIVALLIGLGSEIIEDNN